MWPGAWPRMWNSWPRSYPRRHRASVSPRGYGYAEICSVFGAYGRSVLGAACASPRGVALARSAVDRDPTGLHSRGLWNRYFQNTVGLLGFDLLGVGTLGQSEAAEEAAGNTLDALVAVFGFALLDLALTADSQHAVVGGDVDVLGVNARDVSENNKAILLFVDVNSRNPGNAGRAGS